jgi:hypothetical protein
VQRVHSDIIGPVEVESLSGGHYAVTLLDDCTGLVDVGCFERKTAAGTWLKETIKRWERATGRCYASAKHPQIFYMSIHDVLYSIHGHVVWSTTWPTVQVIL